MTRIDDARAAELGEFCKKVPHDSNGRLLIEVTEDDSDFFDACCFSVPHLLADCADYRARIEELEAELLAERERAETNGLACHSYEMREGQSVEGIGELEKENTRFSNITMALLAGYEAMGEEMSAHAKTRTSEVLADLATIPTPSPTDAPASDTRTKEAALGITYGDHLIDSGHHDITPEQEREIEAREECARRGIDPDAECADGGVTAWMVVDQERRNHKPAPDTRGLAVEIDDEAVEASREAFWQKASEGTCGAHYPRADVMRAALDVALPMILRDALPPAPDTDRKLARAVDAERERCAKIAERDCDRAQFGIEKAARNWEYLESDPTERAVTVYRAGIQAGQMIAVAIRTEPRQSASRPCDAYGGCPDRSTCAGCDLTTAPAEAKPAPDIKPIVEALQGLFDITEDSEGVTGYHKNGAIAAWGEFPEVEAAKTVLDNLAKSSV